MENKTESIAQKFFGENYKRLTYLRDGYFELTVNPLYKLGLSYRAPIDHWEEEYLFVPAFHFICNGCEYGLAIHPFLCFPATDIPVLSTEKFEETLDTIYQVYEKAIDNLINTGEMLSEEERGTPAIFMGLGL